MAFFYHGRYESDQKQQGPSYMTTALVESNLAAIIPSLLFFQWSISRTV